MVDIVMIIFLIIKKNNININNSMRNIYDAKNRYDYKTNEQTLSSGTILSQAAKSNFLI